MDDVLLPELQQRQAQSLYRSRQVVDGPQGPVIEIKGKSYLNFCSNDYLGLANHHQVIAAFQKGAQEFGVGSGASHLINGHSRAHHALEEELAEFLGRPRALLFSTGYMANLGVVSALVGKGDAVFEDRLNHASLIEAGLLSGARMQRYLHGDVSSLQNHLAKSEHRRKLVLSDGVFSMDGDLAPLHELAKVAKQNNAWFMVDDAHGFGVLGESGKGCLEHFTLGMEEVPIYMATLGKALGTFGAFVAGSEALVETLIQKARSYIYTTALPPAVAEATRKSLQLLREEGWRREKLQSLIALFRKGAQELGLNMMVSETPIQPLLISDVEKTVALSQSLVEKGVMVSAIRPPTVPEGSARLRITLSAAHTEEQVTQLLDALAVVA